MEKSTRLQAITLITTHFYDFSWIELWIRKVRRYTDPDRIREILIVDQDRSAESARRLAALDPQVRVLAYPRSEAHFKVVGHDHASVLNRAVCEARGEWVLLLDSDAYPIKDGWLQKCEGLLAAYDAILAQVPGQSSLSHPCFMLFKQEQAHIPLLFDEGLFTENIDTGRLVGEQLKRAGQKVLLVPPVRAFGGRWGTLYLNSIYHHKSGSFLGGGQRLKAQVDWKNKFFRELILRQDRYELAFGEVVTYAILDLLHAPQYAGGYLSKVIVPKAGRLLRRVSRSFHN